MNKCIQINILGCQKSTWAGCGLHIESALQGVPEYERCAGWRTGNCPDKPSSSATSASAGQCGLS